MVVYQIFLTKQALKDIDKLKSANLSAKAKKLIDIIQIDPFQSPPPYEKLVGNLQGFYSRRINIQHRLVYEVSCEDEIIKIVRLWTHYE